MPLPSEVLCAKQFAFTTTHLLQIVSLESLKSLEPRQVMFLRALVALGVTDWTPHIKIGAYADNLYAGGVRCVRSDIDRHTIRPLAGAGFIEHRMGSGARGAKALEVRPTKKFVNEVAEPILEPRYKAVRQDMGRVFGTSFAQLIRNIQQSNNDLRGNALEILAVRISRLLDLEYGGLRKIAGNVFDNNKVGVSLSSPRLINANWQLRCQRSDISADDVATEVGLTHLFNNDVILIATTGCVNPRGTGFIRALRDQHRVEIVTLGETIWERMDQDDAAVLSTIREQSPLALCAA